MNPHPRCWAEIDLEALAHNLAELRSRLGQDGAEIALVAKADAYGHGLVPVARHALRHGASWAAVATVQEGIALRDAGIDARIVVLSPILPIEAEQGVFYGLDLMFEEPEVLDAVAVAAEGMGRAARLHLKVDTGIHRFGCRPEDALPLALAAQAKPRVELVGLAQHFADSTRDPATTARQLAEFQAVVARLAGAGIRPPVLHAANSAGAVRWSDSRFTLVRAGLVAYGVDPFGWLEGAARPVMSWWSRVTSVRQVPAGSAVGYSGTHVLRRDSRLATVGVGYGDGYPRALSNRAAMDVQGCLAPVVGLVCMDQTILDVTDCPPVRVGDPVRVIGGQVTAGMLADAAGTNAHEIVTRLMSRVPRKYRA